MKMLSDWNGLYREAEREPGARAPDPLPHPHPQQSNEWPLLEPVNSLYLAFLSTGA